MQTIKNIFNKLYFRKWLAFCLFTFAFLLLPFALPAVDVGDYGSWATDANREVFVQTVGDDINGFAGNLSPVPIEAKIGRIFIGAMSHIANILDASLVRFMIILMCVLFVFWTGLEAYQMIKTGSKPTDLFREITKKAVIITLWIAILNIGAAKLFMLIMGPVISIGTYFSDLILGAVTTSLPDTCGAIREYVAARSGGGIMNATQTADLLCLPTRLSGFFYTAVSAGWEWMKIGIGHSAFTFAAGVTFVVIFIYNIWKFALMGLSVIADLFLSLIMLPFTAIYQSFGGKSSKDDPATAVIDAFGDGSSGTTSYDGIAGKIFNQFLTIFKPESLTAQVTRFINAVIYFVSLSIVVAICAAILSSVIDIDLVTNTPSIATDDFMTVLLS